MIIFLSFIVIKGVNTFKQMQMHDAFLAAAGVYATRAPVLTDGAPSAGIASGPSLMGVPAEAVVSLLWQASLWVSR